MATHRVSIRPSSTSEMAILVPVVMKSFDSADDAVMCSFVLGEGLRTKLFCREVVIEATKRGTMSGEGGESQ